MQRFEFRLGSKTPDRELAGYMEADREEGANLSNLIKELLRAYYRGDLDQFNRPGNPRASQEIARRAAIADKLRGVSFDKLGG